MTESRVSRRFSTEGSGLWTKEEHQRFLSALEIYPNGPWRKVSELVGTRNLRQIMTHAQKHRQKLERHKRGLRSGRPQLTESASVGQMKPAPRSRPAGVTRAGQLSASTEVLTQTSECPIQTSHEDTWSHPVASPVDVSGGFYASSHDLFSKSLFRLESYYPLAINYHATTSQAWPPSTQHTHLTAHDDPLSVSSGAAAHIHSPPLEPLPIHPVPDAMDHRWLDDCFQQLIADAPAL